MKIVAEPLYKTNQLMVRLLGSDVQIGLYKLDATPAVPEEKTFEVFQGMVRQEETRLYFTGFARFPDFVKVTLPDLSVQTINLVEVIVPKDEIFTVMPQSEETITKPEKEIFQAPTLDKIETVSPPEIPRLWFEIALERTSPLTLGEYVSAVPLIYQGGAEGRVLTSSVVQPALNFPPYLLNTPVRFEGAWSNNLSNSDFSGKEKKPFLLDYSPVGWDIQLVNPEDMLRLQITKANPLPSLNMIWRPQESDRSAVNVQQRVTMRTPTISEGRIFQALLSPDSKNERGGFVRLASANGLYSAGDLYLEPGVPRSIRLNVEDDPGPVTIIWYQKAFQRENQLLTLVAPMASTYGSLHTWGPVGSSATDILEIPSLIYENRRWPLHQGLIRVDSDVEAKTEPVSWRLDSTLGFTFLKVEAGLLSSSFASTVLTLSDYLPTALEEAGNYKIKWSSEGVRLISRSQPGGISVPFNFDLPIPNTVKEAPLKLTVKSFEPTRGSGVLRYFGFFPK